MRSALILTVIAAAASAAAAAETPAERGKAVFERACAACHGQGPGDDGSPMLPGSAALQARYKGELPAHLELRSDLTADQLRYFVRSGIGAMPMFRKTEVSDEDIDAMAAYLAASSQTHERTGTRPPAR